MATKSRELPAATESTLAGALTAVDAAVPAAAAAGGAVAGALAWDAGTAYKHVATDYSKSTGTTTIHSTKTRQNKGGKSVGDEFRNEGSKEPGSAWSRLSLQSDERKVTYSSALPRRIRPLLSFSG